MAVLTEISHSDLDLNFQLSPQGAALVNPLDNLLIRIPQENERQHWRTPILIAIGINLAIFLAGYYSPKSTLLELMSNGEQLANFAPSVEEYRQEVEIVDLAPPPPPEDRPEFIKPEEKPKVAEAPKPTPKPKPVVQSQPQAPASAYASSSFVSGNKNCPKPPYPYLARQRHYQGTVMVALSVVAGHVVSADVQSSSGYGVLDSHAASWIRQRWTFPESITASVVVPIKFELSNG
jgi:TonB family protein